jgi:hypothetical protein
MRRLALPMQVSVAGPNGDSIGLSGLLEMMRSVTTRFSPLDSWGST